jgi:hypothetical protein
MKLFPLSYPLIVLLMVFGSIGSSSTTQAAQPSYDPPKPSADFGTPEGTAKIAANAQPLDIIGVKLGMPVKEALAAVKAHNPNIKMQPGPTLEFEALPGVVMTPVLTGHGKVSDDVTESIGLLVTVAPNEAFVEGVWRYVSFGRPVSRSPVDTILSGMRKKYGPESVKDDARLLWVFDAQGQQVMGPKAKDIWGKCERHWESGFPFNLDTVNRHVIRGYYGASDGRDDFGGICHSHSVVHATYLAGPAQGASQDLVMEVKVKAVNARLQASGVTATNVLLTREAEQLAEKRKAEASKRAAPKF